MIPYLSTRGKAPSVAPRRALISGLAPDGGLYLPETLPAARSPETLAGASYQTLAAGILSAYFPDIPKTVLKTCVKNAYETKFDCAEVVPVRALSDGDFLAELWHGPTCAFKDLALSLLPQLLTSAYRLEGRTENIAILTATSGDTGKAALEGFADVEHTLVTVLYPQNGVSPIQERQMTTSRGKNVQVYALQGNFDDCQRLVKDALVSGEIRSIPGISLSSANSINIGRIVAQTVYYWSSYLDLRRRGAVGPGEEVLFCVPSGNFGDILAGFLAKKGGLPIRRLICASNSNRVLTDFIRTGQYSLQRPFYRTMSPSMDILVSSNLERLLFLLSCGPERVRKWMDDLRRDGRYRIPARLLARLQEDFAAFWCSEEECRAAIRRCWTENGILIDPHTAVAVEALRRYREESGDCTSAVILSTASPFKFGKNVLASLTGTAPEDDFQANTALSALTGLPVPAPLADLEERPVRFTESLKPEEALGAIASHLREECV